MLKEISKLKEGRVKFGGVIDTVRDKKNIQFTCYFQSVELLVCIFYNEFNLGGSYMVYSFTWWRL